MRRHWPLAVDAALYALLVVLFTFSNSVVSVPLAVAQLLPLVIRRRDPGGAAQLLPVVTGRGSRGVALAGVAAATAALSRLGMARGVGSLPMALALFGAATHRSAWVRWGACGAAVVLVTVTGGIRHGP